MPQQPMSYSAAVLALHRARIWVGSPDAERTAAVRVLPDDLPDDVTPDVEHLPIALRLDRPGVVALAQAIEDTAPDELPAVRTLTAAGWSVRRDAGQWIARHPDGDDVIFDDAAAMIQFADLVSATPGRALAELLALVPAETPATLLTESLREAARRFVRHRRASGRALLEACRALAQARDEATEGQWGTWLAATHTTPDTAERLLAIHRLALTSEAFTNAFEDDWIGERAAAQLARAITGPRAVSPGLLDYVLSQPTPPTTRQLDDMIRRAADSPAVNAVPYDAGEIPAAIVERLSRLGWDGGMRATDFRQQPKSRGTVPLFFFRHAGTREEREVSAAEAAIWADEEEEIARRLAAQRAAFTAIRDRFTALGWRLEGTPPLNRPPYRATPPDGGPAVTIRSWEALEARLRVLEAAAAAPARPTTPPPPAPPEVVPAAAAPPAIPAAAPEPVAAPEPPAPDALPRVAPGGPVAFVGPILARLQAVGVEWIEASYNRHWGETMHTVRIGGGFHLHRYTGQGLLGVLAALERGEGITALPRDPRERESVGPPTIDDETYTAIQDAVFGVTLWAERDDRDAAIESWLEAGELLAGSREALRALLRELLGDDGVDAG